MAGALSVRLRPAAPRSSAHRRLARPSLHPRPPVACPSPAGPLSTPAECTGRTSPPPAARAPGLRRWQRDVDALAEQQLALQAEMVESRSVAVDPVPAKRAVGGDDPVARDHDPDRAAADR